MRSIALVVFLIGCGRPPSPVPHPPPAAPPQLPPGLVTYMTSHAWGQMHLEWHGERRWDLLPPTALAYAQRQGWQRAAHQEGEAGNGIEFLAMHRAMLEVLAERDPSAKVTYLAGWATPPIDPHDPTDPLPGGATTAFEPEMLAAIERLHHLDTFASEDELGLFVETAMRPTPGAPEARAADRSAGIHNYLHNRFQDPTSRIDLGNPAVNLMNAQFWRLHGWIDRLWSAYRAQAGLHDTDADHVQRMITAREAMTMRMKAGPFEAAPRELIDAVRP